MTIQNLSQRIRNSALWQQTQHRYEQCAPREKQSLQVLCIGVLVSLIYFLIWQPTTEWAQQRESDYLYQKETSLWLNDHLNKAKKLLTLAPKGDITQVVNRLAQQTGITLAKVRPDRQGLAVWVEDAAYQKLLKWLVLLQNQHHISVQQIRIDSLPEDGRVKSYLLLSQ
ncbi:type II secretion system protein M [uncultured Endozoicomonas sp.]|uniref:type II secretion system protein M n=1 Tax=uncultured Endozoicomonas sp. TaxID=432652 RepID=UPI00261C61C0|nr:type II secretion system protein M [uncultured Endozoicomonas sp.]